MGGGASNTNLEEVDLHRSVHAFYDIGDVLGEGGFSIVREGFRIIDRQRVAVKIMNRTEFTEEDEVCVQQEIKILSLLDHPNIVKLFDVFVEEKVYNVVLEYIGGGELFDRIVKKERFNEKEARDLVVIVLNALKYCHDKNIVHRDLKPENLLLTSKDDDASLKIVDFGFAAEVDGFSISTPYGTPGYIAPEILLAIKHGKPVDMWSFGVILYILLGGYAPFQDDNQKKLFRKIIKGEYKFHSDRWDSISDEAKELIRCLLTFDPVKRYTVDQALAHPWVTKDAKILEQKNLNDTLKQLTSYQAKKRFKEAATKIIAVQRFNPHAFVLDGADLEELKSVHGVTVVNELLPPQPVTPDIIPLDANLKDVSDTTKSISKEIGESET